ncbi:hypothetical protein O7632_12860 [Solwaraspora sp. WMMD406]|uniref:hypothetical protein n=1 Tax=Solwaraspora sp. WMMD406 TaxID=3016095 RepID=UPI0024160D50|nr:hypothetical protein [Solwaraspora sp. WMMD406]MDG4764982.1 hypothetical protein [Solwaraspora sp. WMMD406]
MGEAGRSVDDSSPGHADQAGHADPIDKTSQADDWADRRQRAIAAHDAAQRQRRAVEARDAARLLTDFVRAAALHDIAPVPLVARPYRGWPRYRTGLHGWYLKADRSLAVGTDGQLYLLSVPPSLRAWLFGARIAATEPRMVIGAGGRDGESIPLADLLKRLLGSADDRP